MPKAQIPMTPPTENNSGKQAALPKIFRLVKCRFPIEQNPHLKRYAGIWEIAGWKDLTSEYPTMMLRAFHYNCPTEYAEAHYYPEMWSVYNKIEWTEDPQFNPKKG